MPSYKRSLKDLQQLTDMAVEVRYPGLTADAEDAAIAIAVAERVRQVVRAALGMT